MIALALVACASPPPPVSHVVVGGLKSADLEADLDVLETSYRALHPGLGRYNSPAELDALFASARRAFRQDQTLEAAYLELTRLTAALRCGHSFPNPSNQPRATQAALFERVRVPWLFEWFHGDMMVTRDLSGHAIVPGSIIESIDGVPARTMLTTLLPFARADGHNDAKRIAYLGDRGDGPHEGFDILAPLIWPGVFDGRPLQLVVRAPSGQRSSLAIAPQTLAEREAAAPAPDDRGESGPLWSVTMDGDVAVLPMRTWVAFHSKRDWRADIDAIMESVIGKRALIIDLRGNEGGSDVGDAIVAHLIDRPVRRGAMSRRIRFRSVPQELRPNLDTWDPSFVELGKDATPLADGWFELPAEPGTGVIEPKAPRFRGKVIVLVDASNSSATFQFALTVQQQQLGTLIGTPTGGNQRGINGGAFFFLQLPRTKLEVDLPLIGTFPDGAAPDRGVTPDVTIETTPADLAAGRDPVEAEALSLARR